MSEPVPTAAHLQSLFRMVRGVLKVPRVAEAIAAVGDDELREAGLSPEEIATLRAFTTPLPNFSWLVAGAVAGSGQPRGAGGIAALKRAGVARLISLTPEPLAGELVAAAGLGGLHLPVGALT